MNPVLGAAIRAGLRADGEPRRKRLPMAAGAHHIACLRPKGSPHFDPCPAHPSVLSAARRERTVGARTCRGSPFPAFFKRSPRRSAIRRSGFGGSLIYSSGLTEARVWQHEFRSPGAANAALVAPLATTLAQTMRTRSSCRGSLLPVSIQLAKTPQIEIADTLGLVQSQAVESPDCALRVTLNGSMGAQTLSSRFLLHYMGAGVQHLAFATADVFAAAEAARANGLATLEIPHNYYDDIEAKFGLDRELVERPRKLNILYARDGTAEYFSFIVAPSRARVFRGRRARGYELMEPPTPRSDSPPKRDSKRKALDCAPQSHRMAPPVRIVSSAPWREQKTACARSPQRSRAARLTSSR